MRRKDREIVSIEDKIDIIHQCKVCRLGLSENDTPYIVPLNYGYGFENNTLTLFFHSAKEGKKVDMIKKNRKACFEVDCDKALMEDEKACKHSYAYKSVIGFGEIIRLESNDEKSEALNKIMRHQTGKDIAYHFTENELYAVTVYKMEVNEFTGKRKAFSIGCIQPRENTDSVES